MRVLKKELIRLVRTEAKKAYTNEEVADILDTYAEIVRKQMLVGNEVTLDGVGKFQCKHIDAHDARNPGSGETVEVAEHYKPKFSFFVSFIQEMRDTDLSNFQQAEPEAEPEPEEKPAATGRRVQKKK